MRYTTTNNIYPVEHYNVTLIDKKMTPRMPWHDIALGMVRKFTLPTHVGYSSHLLTLLLALLIMQVGTPARDVARHFVQRWNHVKATKGQKRLNLPFLTPKGEFVPARDETKFKGTCRVQIVRSSSDWSQGCTREVQRCYVLNMEF